MITIIGAGPVGNYLGYLLAKEGKDVQIFEEHKKAGEPIQCTGIVTKSLFDVIDYDSSYIVNKLTQMQLISPNGNKVCVPVEEYVICRNKFDNYLLRMARKAGAKVFFGSKFEGMENGDIILSADGKKKRLKTDILIGADGPFSKVATNAGTGLIKEYYYGTQAIAKGKFEADTFKVYFGSKYPKFFGWIVPENKEIARIGVGSKKNVKKYFDSFVDELGAEIIKMQGGAIPVHEPAQKIEKENIFVAGDAGGYVKATTGGGLVQGLKSAEIIAAKILGRKRESLRKLKKLKRELWIHLKIRRVLNKFTDADYDKLIYLMNKPRVKKILGTTTRDTPVNMLIELVLTEPRFLLFARKIF